MKMKYRLPMISVLFVLVLLLITGCIQTTVQTTPIPPTTSTASVPTVTAPDAYNLIQQNRNNLEFVILDVRTAGEFNAGHIAGAVNKDYTSAQFTADVSLLDKSTQYLVYCQTGVRGAAATQIMIGLGFSNVENMAGGITAWVQDGYPVTAPATSKTTTTSAQSSNGLRLQVSVNTTALTSGQTLLISVSEYNTLPAANNVVAAENWGVNGLVLGACSNLNELPFGVALFQGSYNAQNISQAAPLPLFPAVPCPLLIRLITGYDFLPDSINAAIMPGGDLSTPTPMSGSLTVNGTYSLAQLRPLAPGAYTLVVGDEWGALEFLYISVE
ncbi:MAG TPA: rhodanese-like domain-containing protein [Dehalococcoidales bacterium]|jgi:Rhodanese-related sulfurtransferase|nr:rhodanese-like domain-containing protein [Dehalococcoidales bacterium]